MRRRSRRSCCVGMPNGLILPRLGRMLKRSSHIGPTTRCFFSPDGKLAYMRGKDELTVPGPSGAPATVHLRGISIWRLDADGQWHCVVDISNEEPAAAPMAK